MIITSLTNPKIKQIVKLRDRKTREESGLTVVEGAREILRAFEAGVRFQEVYLCRDILDSASDRALARFCKAHEAVLNETSKEVFAKIGYGDRQDGVLGVCFLQPKGLKDIRWTACPLIVVAEHVEKPGNLGAILRTCDAAGVDALIVANPQTDIFNPNVIRSSLGTVFTVPVFVAGNGEAAEALRQKGVRVCAATPSAETVYSGCDFKAPTAIVVGSEEKGLSPFWMERADLKVKIPMKGRADSLNVSASTAVLVYEALRQRHGPG